MRKRVLIAEDNPINLELVRQILEDDYDLLCASDGERAIELATAEAPDVILMDLSLPRVDGWEATRRLRDDPRAAAPTGRPACKPATRTWGRGPF